MKREPIPIIAAASDPSTPWTVIRLRKNEHLSSPHIQRRIKRLKQRVSFLRVTHGKGKGGLFWMRPALSYAYCGDWKRAAQFSK